MKANQRFRNTMLRTHAIEGEYKIPIKDRQNYAGSNEAKWVSEKEYKKYKEWVKKGKPKR